MLRFNDTFESTRDIDVIAKFAKILSGKKVLEIGCGGCERTALFKNAGCQVTSVDIIDVRKSNFTIEGDNFFLADGRSLPFVSETFDAVVSFDVIEHIDYDELFLNNAYRVCKKGGYLMLGTPNRNRLSNRFRQILGKRICYPLDLGGNCIHLREYTMNELSRLVKSTGFKVKKEEYIWLGLLELGGFKYFPTFLNEWVQSLIVLAIKPEKYNMIELEYIECAICRENKDESLMEVNNTHGSYFISDEIFRLVKCNDCGLVYINPRPIHKEINKYYSCDYYSYGGNNLKASIEKMLSYYYLSRQKKMIMQFKKEGKILDVGCGSGSFIASFSSKKWEPYGVEPNLVGYNLSKQKMKNNILNKELLDCKFPDNYFEVITMWHVLEHIYNPNEELQEINRILKDDGVFILSLPNIKSLGFRIGGKHWFHLDAPRHLYHYDSTTITEMLTKNGFQVIKITFPFVEYPLDLYHSLINKLGRNKFTKVLFILPTLLLSLILKPLSSLFKVSETMILYCKKGV